jgi:hypothetical protein
MQSRLVSGDKRRPAPGGTGSEIPANSGYFADRTSAGPQLSYFEGMVRVRSYIVRVTVENEAVGEMMHLEPVSESEAAALTSPHVVEFVLELDTDLRFGRMQGNRVQWSRHFMPETALVQQVAVHS